VPHVTDNAASTAKDVIDLVGRTGHDEGPWVYRSCKKEAAAGRNQARDIHLSRNRAPDLPCPFPPQTRVWA